MEGTKRGGERDSREAARRLIAGGIAEHQVLLTALTAAQLEPLLDLAEAVRDSWLRGGKLLVCGNGGSAADAQHIAAELVGRFLRERPAYAAIALTTDTSILTSVANDYGFTQVFARQIEGLGRPGDVLLVISTSGNSPNCLEAAATARRAGLRVYGFLGHEGGRLASLVDGALVAPSSRTPRIQEVHTICGHLLCDLLESWLAGAPAPGDDSGGRHEQGMAQDDGGDERAPA
jgi:D-sedoheptulose 7-phosphate isomerase